MEQGSSEITFESHTPPRLCGTVRFPLSWLFVHSPARPHVGSVSPLRPSDFNCFCLCFIHLCTLIQEACVEAGAGCERSIGLNEGIRVSSQCSQAVCTHSSIPGKLVVWPSASQWHRDKYGVTRLTLSLEWSHGTCLQKHWILNFFFFFLPWNCHWVASWTLTAWGDACSVCPGVFCDHWVDIPGALDCHPLFMRTTLSAQAPRL